MNIQEQVAQAFAERDRQIERLIEERDAARNEAGRATATLEGIKRAFRVVLGEPPPARMAPPPPGEPIEQRPRGKVAGVTKSRAFAAASRVSRGSGGFIVARAMAEELGVSSTAARYWLDRLVSLRVVRLVPRPDPYVLASKTGIAPAAAARSKYVWRIAGPT